MKSASWTPWQIDGIWGVLNMQPAWDLWCCVCFELMDSDLDWYSESIYLARYIIKSQRSFNFKLMGQLRPPLGQNYVAGWGWKMDEWEVFHGDGNRITCDIWNK